MGESYWDIKGFRELIKQRLPHKVSKQIEISLEAIIWKNNLCKYHIEEYRQIVQKSYTNDTEQIVQTTGKILHMAARTEEGKDYFLALFIAEAHIIAFAQALHSIADIMAHVIYFSLGMESFRNDQISLHNVHELMKKKNTAPEIIERISNYRESEQFQYLHAFVNTTKHKSLVPLSFSVELFNEKHGLRFGEFTYRTLEPYPSKWADELVEADYKRLLSWIQEMGELMINFLINNVT